jgi:hypothetical protein
MPRLHMRGARFGWLVLVLAACSGERGESPVGRAAQADGATGWKIVTIADFNADGLGDVLWTHPSTGRIAVFLLRGTGLLEPGRAIPGPHGAAWAPVGSGADFNFDGMADVTWFNAGSSRAAVWLMRGTHLAEPGPEIPGPRGDGWVVPYVGDFNGDGMSDLIWYNDKSGLFTVWLMNGTHLVEAGPEIPGPSGGGWALPTLGDFNADGKFDIVWRNTSKNLISIWLMWGTQVLERGPEIPCPGNDWVIPTTADFNFDGMADLVWNDPVRNRAAIWLMRGTCLFEPGPELPGPPGEGWYVGSAADTDGDGVGDLVWGNTLTGRFEVWRMRETHVLAFGPELPGPP